MDKKNPSHKRNERPNAEEEERAEKSGLKGETKTQGLKSDHSKLPEEDPVEAEDDDEEEDEEDEE